MTSSAPRIMLVAAWCLCHLLCGCVHHAKKTDQGSPSEVQGIANVMLEVDRYGQRYTNALNRTPIVDAHSTLVMEFPRRPGVSADALSPEWQELQSILKLLNEYAMEWQRLTEDHRTLNRTNTNDVEQFRNKVRALVQKANRFLDELGRLGLTGDQLAAILNGTAPGITRDSKNGYLNLAQWTTNHWAELRANAQAFEDQVAAERKVKITVQAFRESLFREPSVLHVDNWDELPEGVYSPIDRTGLRPTEAEQKRLEMARQAAESVVSLVNSARTNEMKFKATLKSTVDDLKARLQTLNGTLDKLARNWETELLKEINRILDQTRQGNDPAGVKDAATRLQAALQGFQTDILGFQKIVKVAVELPQKLAPAGKVDPLALMFGDGSPLQAIDKTIKAFGDLPNRLTSWDERLKSMTNDVQILGAKLTDEMSKLVADQLTPFLAGFRKAFPRETETVMDLLKMLNRNSLGTAGALEVLGDADGKLIARTSDQLVDGRLDLKRAGLALGDVVSLRVRGTNVATGEKVVNATYYHEVGFIGLHGKPAVHFIFARGLSGPEDATDWKPNVAAAVEWHYTIRDPKTTAKKTWNWLYPAVGIHLASLDQSEDNFEIGAGGNISFWDGLLTGGFGFNFSAERPYVWVGVNLLAALSEAKNVMPGKR